MIRGQRVNWLETQHVNMTSNDVRRTLIAPSERDPVSLELFL
jgi:hypothetical protein